MRWLIFKYYENKGVEKKVLYCKIAVYLQTLADYLHMHIFLYLLQTKRKNADNEEEWIHVFYVKNSVTWFIILKLLFHMFLYTRVTSLIQSLL
jgi:hypothetical protein